jgi:hypothetical protein
VDTSGCGVGFPILRNVRGLLGIAEWIEESGHPRKAEAVRVMAHQLDEVVGELSEMVVEVP